MGSTPRARTCSTRRPACPRRLGPVGCAVVGQEPLRHAVGGDALVEHGDRGVAGLPRSNQGGDRQAGVVVLQLEDDGLAPAGQDVLGGVQPPAGVGGRIDEPAPGRAGALAGLAAGHALAAEDPRRGRGRGGLQPHRAHLVVHRDGAVVQPRGLQRASHRQSPQDHLLADPGRAGCRAGRARLEGRRRSFGPGPGPYRVERLAPDALLGAEGAHRAPGGVVGPLRDRQADTGINTRILSTHPAIPAEVSPPRAPEPSPMS